MPMDETLTPKIVEELIPLDDASKELVDAGVFYGRKRTKTNPRMKPYIAGNRNEIEIINPQKTQEGVAAACVFLETTTKNGGLLLFVGTQPAAQGVVELAKEFNCPVVAARWLGGTLTNFKIISKRIEYYTKLKSDFANNALEKYTKKERVGLEREMKRMTPLLAGLETLTHLPAALVVVDPNPHLSAVREARRLKIPIVALVSTDGDPDLITYLVPGNSKSQTSINWFLGKIKTAIEAGRKAMPVTSVGASEKPAVVESQKTAEGK